MTDLSPPLHALGRDRERAIRAELAAGAPVRWRFRSRRVAVAGIALALAIPGAAIGAGQLLSSGPGPQGLPDGTQARIGKSATCTVVTANVEYRCTSPSPPAGAPPSAVQGAVEPMFDTTKRVNGACRALDANATTWECYLGAAAVANGVIGSSLLGQYPPG